MKKLFLLLLTVLTISLCASAQTRTVTGSVLDADSHEEIIGASVTAGPGTGAVTDVTGHFSIKVPASATHLTVSYVGYQTQEVAIKAGDMVILLAPDNKLLDDVIVVAYGKQTKSSFTGSAAVVGSATIEKTQVTNVLDALNGKVPGLQLSNASGAPGATSPTIRVRGFSSLLAGNAPLVIVDGVPYTGDINSLNTNDIESMSVLKDAASNALYGARGANGVILITTKRAKLGEATVVVDAKWGANMRAAQDYNYITDPRQYYETYYKALYNYASYDTAIGGLGMSASAANLWANQQMTSNTTYGLGYNVMTVPNGQLLIGSNGRLNPNATIGRKVLYNGTEYFLSPDNWLDETYCTGLRQEYNVNITQGTERSNLMIAVGYLDNDGIVKAPSDFRRFTGRVNADFQAKSWLKVGANVAYSHVDLDSSASSGEGASNSTGNMFAFAAQVAPIYPMYMRDGNGNIMVDDMGITRYDYGAGLNAGARRPILTGANGISDAILNQSTANANNFNGTGFVEIRLPYNFTITSNNNVSIQESRSTSTNNPFYGQFASSGGMVYKTHTRNTDYTFQQLINWNQSYGANNVSVLLGHEWYKNQYTYLYGNRNNMFLPSNTELAGSIISGDTNSYTDAYNNEGWFARGQYDYEQKYFASASFRRDASSRFHPKHRWGSFWSLGGAWIISKEDFFNVDWINQLKLKASYGEQGNDNIGDFRYVDTYTLINASGYPAATPSTKGNENITWEKGGNFNVGVEFQTFNSRLNGSIEGFYRKTTDMLMSFPLPASSGFMGYYANVGDMMNAGVEIDLQATPIHTRDFSWTIGVNFTWYKNKILKLPEERKGYELEGYKGFTSSGVLYAEGLPMYTMTGYKYAGVDPTSGKALYYKEATDEDGNYIGTTTTDNGAEASTYILGEMLAHMYGGFNTAFEYKGFDLSATFNYQIGGTVNDSNYASLMGVPDASSRGTNIHVDIDQAWTPENPNSNVPRFMFGDLYTGMGDRFYTNASYLSLENINFGYTLPSSIVKKMYLSKLRVYFAADNIWVWSHRKGLDPRQSFTGGVNNTYYSPVRTLSGGFTVTF